MKKFYAIISIFLSLSTTGCISENVECPAIPALSEEYKLNIEISADDIFTRTEGHTLFPGNTDENFIKISEEDYQFYILDGETKLVLDVFQPNDINITAKGYKLTGYFKPGKDVKSIRVMALANWMSFVNAYPEIKTDLSIVIEDLYTNSRDYNFLYPRKRNEAEDLMTWTPEDGERGIPMFGLSRKIIIPEGKESDYNAGFSIIPELELTSVSMLRALAKVIVTDATEDDDVKILSVKFKKFVNNGRFIPDGTVEGNKQWFLEGSQISVPTLSPKLSTGENLYFLGDEEGKNFVAYIPEIDGKSERSIFTPGEDFMEIETQYKEREPVTHIISFGNYNEDRKYEEGSTIDILRNHRYCYNITSITDNSIELTIRVNDSWDVIHDMELQ